MSEASFASQVTVRPEPLADARRRPGRAPDGVTTWDGRLPVEPVTVIGLEAPEGLPAGSDAITLDRLTELIAG